MWVLTEQRRRQIFCRLWESVRQDTEKFRGNDGVYLHRMSDSVPYGGEKDLGEKRALEPGELRYLTLRLLHEIKDMHKESELDTCFTRSQIAIVKGGGVSDSCGSFQADYGKKMAEFFLESATSSFKWYVRGIFGR